MYSTYAATTTTKTSTPASTPCHGKDDDDGLPGSVELEDDDDDERAGAAADDESPGTDVQPLPVEPDSDDEEELTRRARLDDEDEEEAAEDETKEAEEEEEASEDELDEGSDDGAESELEAREDDEEGTEAVDDEDELSAPQPLSRAAHSISTSSRSMRSRGFIFTTASRNGAVNSLVGDEVRLDWRRRRDGAGQDRTANNEMQLTELERVVSSRTWMHETTTAARPDEQSGTLLH